MHTKTYKIKGNTTTRTFKDRIITYEKAKIHIAVSLDFDLIAEGDNINTAMSRLDESTSGYLEMCCKDNEPDAKIYRKAPQEYQDKWPHRNTAIAILQDHQGKVLVLQNVRNNNLSTGKSDVGALKLPQGGIEPNEDPQTAIIRELKEELDLDPTDFEIISSLNETFSYFFKNKNKPDFEIKLHPFLIKLNDESILSKISVDETEIGDYYWTEPNELTKLNFNIREEAYKSILSAFKVI